MKHFRLIIVVVALLGAGYAWWTRSAPGSVEAPAKPAETPKPAPAPKPSATGIAPPKPTVDAPTLPPAAVNEPPPAPAPAAASDAPQLQSNLDDCIAQSIELLKAKDILNLVKTLMPPDAVQNMIASGQAASVEDIATYYSGRPEAAQVMTQLQQVLESVKTQTPEMNPDSSQASYKMDASVSDYSGPGSSNGNIYFVKVNGYWYLK